MAATGRIPLGAMARVVVAGLATALALACGPAAGDRIAEARSDQARGDFAASIEPLRALLAETPDQPEASYLLGIALLQSGRRGPAVWPLVRAAESPAFAADAGLLLATTLQETGNFEAAIDAASKVLSLTDPPPQARLVRARARLAAKDATAALADLDALLADAPERIDALTLRGPALEALDRRDDAREAFERAAEIAERSGDPDAASRACLALAAFEERSNATSERTRDRALACLALAPDDTGIIAAVSGLLDRASRPDEAMQLWRAALERHPDDLVVRASLATRLERRGDAAEAETLWRETAERLDNATAWQLLAEHHRRQGRTDAARAAITRAIEKSGDPNGLLAFIEADLLIDLGDLEQAEARMASLEDPALRQLLRGRIELARADPTGALAALDAGILAWPDNAGARALAAQAALQLGDPERALEEYRAAFRASGGRSASGLAAARLHLALGDPAAALTLLQTYLSRQPDAGDDAYLLLSRALLDLGEPDAARAALEPLASREEARPSLLLARARIAARQQGSEAAAQMIESGELDVADAASQPLIEAAADWWLEAGEPERAFALVERALSSDARASLHQLRGRLLLDADRDREAEDEFQRARELDPRSGEARVGLALVAARAGNLRAVGLHLDRALAAPTLDPAARYAAVRLLRLAGRRDEARAQLEALLRVDPGHARACAELARVLAEDGRELDRALALARRAERLQPGVEARGALDFVEGVRARGGARG